MSHKTNSKIIHHMRYMLKDQTCATAITQPKIIKSFFYSLHIRVEKQGDTYRVMHLKTQIGDSVTTTSIQKKEDFLRAFFMEMYNAQIKKVNPKMVIENTTLTGVDTVEFLTFCSSKLSWMYSSFRL